MKRRITLLLAGPIFLCGRIPLAASGQEGQKTRPKIALLNTATVVQGTAEGKQQFSELEKFAAERQKMIQAQSEELQALQSQLSSQQRALNPATRAQMEQAITAKERQLRRLQEDLEMDYRHRLSEFLNRTGEKIRKVVAEYAEQNGIAVVFVKEPPDPYFAYFSPTFDVTSAIIKVYDQKYPVRSQTATP